jgi:hypothetical protein
MEQERALVWNEPDGSKIWIYPGMDEDLLLQVLIKARRTVRGQYPSLNSEDTINRILDMIDENYE